MARPRKRKSGPSGKHRPGAFLLLRMTPEQKAAYTAKAKRAKRSVSDWIRVTLDEAQ